MKFLLHMALMIFPFIAVSQHASDIVDYSSFNQKFLEHLLFQEVNAYRLNKGRTQLMPDSTLLFASENHAEYLLNKKTLTHYQKGNKALRDPQLRVEYFGGQDLNCGENILTYTEVAGKNPPTQSSLTYLDLAKVLAELWWKSKPHKANMISPDFMLSAISIKLDTKSYSIYAVQVFGEVMSAYEYRFSPKTFPYFEMPEEKKKRDYTGERVKSKVKYAYGLKTPQAFADCPPSSKKKWNTVEGTITITRDKMLFCAYELNDLNGLFRNKKDGIAMELVSFDNQYSCGEELEEEANTRNGFGLIDGELYKPIYRNEIGKQIEELKEKARKQKKSPNERRCNYIQLGETPQGFTKFPYEARMHYIRNKKLCTQVQFSNYCGKILNYKPSNLPVQYKPDEREYTPRSKQTSYRFTVGFDRNSTSFRPEDLEEVIEQLRNKEFQVNSIRIDAFASIEGSERNNRKVFKKRAQVLVAELEKYQDGSIKYHLESKENWDLFYQQIDTTDYYQMKVWEKDRVKEWLRDSVNQEKMEVFLNDQRTATITMVITPVQSNKWKQYMAASEWKEIIVKPEKTDKDLEQLKIIQGYLQRKSWANEEIVAPSSLLIPPGKDYFLFAYRRKIFELKSGAEYEPVSTVERLKDLNKELQDREIDYNIKAIIANYSEEFSSKEKIVLIRSLLSELKLQKADNKLILDIEMWFHIEMANLIYKGHKMDYIKRAEHSLLFIKENYLNVDSSLTKKIELAEYFISFERYDWAREILQTEIEKEEPNIQALTLYIIHCMTYEKENFPVRFYIELERAHKLMTEKQWCRLFVGSCKIPLESFDWPSLRSLYCLSCSELVNASPGESNK